MSNETLKSLADKLDTLLYEVGGLIDSLNCISFYLAEEQEPTPQQCKIFQNAVWSNIQYLERLYTDLQGIHSGLWTIKSKDQE